MYKLYIQIAFSCLPLFDCVSRFPTKIPPSLPLPSTPGFFFFFFFLPRKNTGRFLHVIRKVMIIRSTLWQLGLSIRVISQGRLGGSVSWTSDHQLLDEHWQAHPLPSGIAHNNWEPVALPEPTYAGNIQDLWGSLGGSVGWASDFSSGHDLVVPEFKRHIELTAGSEEPASDRLRISLCPSPTCTLPKLHIRKKEFCIPRGQWKISPRMQMLV